MRDAFCNFCGTAYEYTDAYPRTCGECERMVWSNPSPVVVVVLPVKDGGKTGLLVVRRAIPPVGKLALVSGFCEAGESWQRSAARELEEEANVVIDPASLTPLHFTSTPDGNTVLLFAEAPALNADDLPEFVPNDEASERRVIFDLAEPLAFPLHDQIAQQYLGT